MTYDAATNTASFAASNMQVWDDHTLEVTTAVSDVAGNTMAATYKSNFKTMQILDRQPYFQGTDAGDQVHLHIRFIQSDGGRTLSLPTDCQPLPLADCEIFPTTQAGADAIGPPSPNQNGGALITAITGTFTDPGITFTFTIANGRTFTFTGTVTGSFRMTGTLSGATLAPVSIVLARF